MLHLRDVAADEFDEPVVYDVAERVPEPAEGTLDRLWDVRTRVATAPPSGCAGWSPRSRRSRRAAASAQVC
ncbi:hypothetical protein [Streptomyces sp. NPDC052036]|uniref:hypothetical protein n=1 Tax=Streptomyces sp. NPDC052036 TaxID=3155171 RepID=UPI00344681C8